MNLPVFKIRASACGKIMGQLKSITDKQISELHGLEVKRDSKGLTVKQEEKLELLQKKLMASQSAKPSDKLPETCKSYIKEWIKGKVYNKRKDIDNKYLQKGIQCEDEAINILMDYKNLPWNCKNEERRENDYMTGECDLLYPDMIYDTKCSFDCFTFPLFKTKLRTNHDYYYQGQVYMDLYKVKKYTVAYVLVNTPAGIIEKQIARESYGLGTGDANKVFDRVVAYHSYDKVDMSKRVKCFEFDYDDSVIQRIVARVELCRRYINELIGVEDE